jgi:hypothetical protein
VAYHIHPQQLETLREEIENPRVALPVNTLATVARALVRRTQKLIVGTQSSCSSSTRGAAIHLGVNQFGLPIYYLSRYFIR